MRKEYGGGGALVVAQFMFSLLVALGKLPNIHITPVLKDLHSLAAHQEKDRVQDSAFDFQMHARMCPSILEGTVSQTSQYKNSQIEH